MQSPRRCRLVGNGLVFLSWWADSSVRLPRPSSKHLQRLSSPNRGTNKVCCLFSVLSEAFSWPHPEEPQVWGRRRKFWGRPRPSTWPTPCEEELKLPSLVHLQAPPPACHQSLQPEKTGNDINVKMAVNHEAWGCNHEDKASYWIGVWDPVLVLLVVLDLGGRGHVNLRPSEGKPAGSVSVDKKTGEELLTWCFQSLPPLPLSKTDQQAKK